MLTEDLAYNLLGDHRELAIRIIEIATESLTNLALRQKISKLFARRCSQVIRYVCPLKQRVYYGLA